MGDRSNIIIEDDKDKVYLYGHWMGHSHIAILATALDRARDRWTDASYIARVIFCDMVRGDLDGTTGYGISCRMCDNEYPLLILNCNKQTVRLETEKGKVLIQHDILYFLEHTKYYLALAGGN